MTIFQSRCNMAEYAFGINYIYDMDCCIYSIKINITHIHRFDVTNAVYHVLHA